MIEILFGREFSKEELSYQPILDVVYESLIYDNEIETDHIKQQNTGIKSKRPRSSDDRFLVPVVSLSDMKFVQNYPELMNVVVTLMTTEEYNKVKGSING